MPTSEPEDTSCWCLLALPGGSELGVQCSSIEKGPNLLSLRYRHFLLELPKPIPGYFSSYLWAHRFIHRRAAWQNQGPFLPISSALQAKLSRGKPFWVHGISQYVFLTYLAGITSLVINLTHDYYFKHRLIPRRKKHTLHGNIYRTITLPDGIILNRINFTHDVFKVLKYVTASANKTSSSSLLLLRKRYIPTSPYFTLYVFSILIRAADCLQT